jgi:RNA polymerase sporulation-specific sigma factor
MERDIEEEFVKHEKLIHFVCNRFRRKALELGLEADDVYQMGAEGLVKAIKRYDETKAKFSTFAIPCISGEVRRQLNEWNQGNNSRISRGVMETIFEIKKYSLQKLPVHEIAKLLNQSESLVIVALKYMHTGLAIYLSEKITGNDEDITFHEVIGKEEDYTVVYVNDFINRLDPKERRIVKGVLKDEQQQLIGEDIGITQVQVSRIQKNKIKPKLEAYAGGA